jgi:hypothetical protein
MSSLLDQEDRSYLPSPDDDVLVGLLVRDLLASMAARQ